MLLLGSRGEWALRALPSASRTACGGLFLGHVGPGGVSHGTNAPAPGRPTTVGDGAGGGATGRKPQLGGGMALPCCCVM